jgi:RimJ/RimL family protein N-acetyltransferase
MPALEPVELHTPRLTLRPLRTQDEARLFDIHADGAVMMYSNSLPWTRLEQASGLIDASQKWLASGEHLCLGIVLAGALVPIGTCTLFDIDRVNQRAELGFLLASQEWGRGYMSEALAGLLRHAFSGLALNRIDADTDPRNMAAIKLLERLGFQYEGLLRERWIVGGRKSDAALCGLLRSDWLRRQEHPPQDVA